MNEKAGTKVAHSPHAKKERDRNGQQQVGKTTEQRLEDTARFGRTNCCCYPHAMKAKEHTVQQLRVHYIVV